MPRAVSASASSARVLHPALRAASMYGMIELAILFAFATRTRQAARALSRSPARSLGLPSFTPLAFAAASAAFVRTLIISRSCSATAARTWTVNLLAIGISAAMKSTPASISELMKATFLARRSSFAITSVARVALAWARASISLGRFSDRLPLSISSNSAMISPATLKTYRPTASRWASKPSPEAPC